MSTDITMSLPDTAESIDRLLDSHIEEPKMYNVILLNDDFTTFEFVIYVLMKFFHKSDSEAEKITAEIHQTGKGVAGVFSYDEAETRQSQVTHCARTNNFPLVCVIEQI